MNLNSVILSEHLVLGLENRAFREGLISEGDFTLREHAQPRAVESSLAEFQATDMLCLYDEVWSEEKRFDLQPLNAMAGANIVQPRPSLVRALSMHFRIRGDTHHDWMSSLRDESEFDALRSQAEREAQILLLRDINWHIRDARTCFEAEAPNWREVALYDVDVSHASIAEFLRRNMFWLIDYFGWWFGGGVYNNILDADLLEQAKVPKGLVAQFRFYARSARFDAYFRHLQESYSSLFENSFVGHLESHDLAYDRPPDHTSVANRAPDVATLSRVIRVNLADVAEYFPLPRTLEEAFEFRGHPRLVAFRKILDAWLSSLATDSQLESKLRRELEVVSRDLKKLKQLRLLKEQPVLFGVKSLLSFLPFSGTVVSGLDIIDYFSERHLKARTAWIVTPRSRLD